jgi:hypothetical protein
MKNLTLLLSFSILFQSCLSYKTVDYNNIAANNKKQMIEIQTVDRKNVKGVLIFKDENSMTLENNGATQTIPKEEIYDLKVKKFSALKTLGGVAKTGAWVAAAGGLLILGVWKGVIK